MVDAIKVVKIEEGMETCTIGILPYFLCVRANFIPPKWFAQIAEFYQVSPNTAKRDKDHKNKGIAKYTMLNAVQRNE